jgi:hypothetical protein
LISRFPTFLRSRAGTATRTQRFFDREWVIGPGIRNPILYQRAAGKLLISANFLESQAFLSAW